MEVNGYFTANMALLNAPGILLRFFPFLFEAEFLPIQSRFIMLS